MDLQKIDDIKKTITFLLENGEFSDIETAYNISMNALNDIDELYKQYQALQLQQGAVMQSVIFNELRIGNYIQFSSGSIYPVDIIYKDYTMLKSWFAITLNDEWLNMLGFVFDEEERVFQKQDIRIELVDDDFIFNYFYGLKYIKYVHELQNLYFSLNGIELTVA